MASGAAGGMNVNRRQIKDYLWDCGQLKFYMLEVFYSREIEVFYSAEIIDISNEDTNTTYLALAKKSFELESFIENTTRLVIIYNNNNFPMCMFTLKLIPDCPIVELFDFIKANAFREKKGLLVAFLNEIKKNNPTSIRKIWAGIYETGNGGAPNFGLVKEYMRNGFHLLQDPLEWAVIATTFEHHKVTNIDTATRGFQGSNREKVQEDLRTRLILTETSLHQLLESRHGISRGGFAKTPLGTISGQPFWSIVYDLSENFVPSSKGSFNISFINLKVESKVLERQLQLGKFVEIQSLFRSGELRNLMEHVMEGPQEVSVIIANSPHGRYQSDTELTWKPFGKYSTTLDIGCSEMPSITDTVLLLTQFSDILSHITGHTHPARLYALLTSINFIQSNGHRSLEQCIQDLSCPSLGDFNAVLKSKSPGHIVCAVECIYSVVINPTVLSLDQTRYDEIINAVLEQLTGGISNLFIICNKHNETLPEVLNTKYSAFLTQRLRELGVIGVALPPRIIRVLRAEFIIKEMNELLTLRPVGENPIQVALVKMHCYPQRDGGSITPALSFFSDRPGLVLNTHRKSGMCGILKETEAAQEQVLRQAMAHLKTIEQDYGRASSIGFAHNVTSTRNRQVAFVKQLLLTAKEEHETGRSASGNDLINTDATSARLNELMKRASDLDKAIKAASETGIVVVKPGAASSTHEGRISSLKDLKTLTEEMIQKGILTKFEFNEVDNWAAALQTAVAAQQTAAAGWSAAGGLDPGQGGGSLKRTSRKKISHHSRNKRKNRKASRKYKNL